MALMLSTRLRQRRRTVYSTPNASGRYRHAHHYDDARTVMPDAPAPRRQCRMLLAEGISGTRSRY